MTGCVDGKSRCNTNKINLHDNSAQCAPTSGECDHHVSSEAWASEADSSLASSISIDNGEGGISRSLCSEGLSLLRRSRL